MNSPLLCQWITEINRRFASLGHWQRLTLALFSYGVVLAQSCTLSRVAQYLTDGRGTASLERRLQRWLANAHLNMAGLFPYWIAWVAQQWGQARWLLLVDETKLSNHVAVMVVSVYYQGSAIPLIWRAYCLSDYPAEGQVGILNRLLVQLQAALPAGIEAMLLADRGLGTSPDWQHHLTESGLPFLLRVQRSTRVCGQHGKAHPIGRLVSYGGQWCGRLKVFKKAGWQWRTVYVVWAFGYREPWCLVSNCPETCVALYAWRFSQEASFRDLKSDGFDWQQSRVWLPEHVERLLLVLALSMIWTLATGTQVQHLYPLTKRQERYSVFRLGLDELFARFRSPQGTYLELYLVPDTPCFKSVVL